jgi:HEAT repeats
METPGPLSFLHQGDRFMLRLPSSMACCLLIASSASLLPASSAADKTPDVKIILAHMAAQRNAFNPNEIHDLGVRGLEGLLNRLLPDTVPPPKVQVTEQEILDLIKQLGNEQFEVRERATRKLLALGHGNRPLLIKAVKDPDAEVRQRIKGILDEWDPDQGPDLAPYVEAFWVYSERLIRDKDCVFLLAQRTAAALQNGIETGPRRTFLEYGLRAVSRSCNDRAFNLFRPLLKHDDVSVGVMVVHNLGGYKSNNHFFPTLLLEALASEREPILAEAIDWAPNCWDRKQAREVERLVRQVFVKGNANLKFRASFALMHSYRDDQAYAYILQQTQSTDAGRAQTAIYWLADNSNYQRQATPELLKNLVPYLTSPNNELRRAAGHALGVYSDKKLIENLVQLLGDNQAIIVNETSTTLLEHREKAEVRPVLENAAKNHENKVIRAKAQELLDMLDKK